MNNRSLVIVLLLMSLANFGFSQKMSLEAGVFGGVSNYLGDLQQSRFEMEEMHEAYGVFIRYNLSNHFAIKGQLYKGVISGSDAKYQGLFIARRNLHFRSAIHEASVQAELTLMKFGARDKRMAAPYLFGGIGWFHFNPQAKMNEEWYDLQPLGTEGQHMYGEENSTTYDLVQLSVPLGLGFNMTFGQRINIGAEIGFRKTFTDYLDDVSSVYPDLHELEAIDPMAAAFSYRSPEVYEGASTNPAGEFRGNPSNNDLYFFGGITMSIYLAKWFY